MAVDPLKNTSGNRALQLRRDNDEIFSGIKLYDIDSAIANHISDTILPNVEEFNESIKVPLLYGNPERWKAVREDGYLRDERGMVQVPLVMFKRNSIDRSDSLSSAMNRSVSYPVISSYSKKHKYDRFSSMTNTKRPVEQYNVAIPDYVNITYEVIIWTDFIAHMNKIVEAFQYATDTYWGDKSKFKFRTRIDSFDTTTELSEGSQRIVKTNFTMVVYAYLLPEKFDNEYTTRKSLSPKRVVWGIEADLTTGTNSLTKQRLYNEYSDIIDFMTIRGSKEATFVDADTIKLTGVELPTIPPQLVGSFDTDDWFRVYVNGVYIPPAKYTYTSDYNTKEIVFDFNTGSVSTSTDLGYELDASAEFSVIGKFIEV